MKLIPAIDLKDGKCVRLSEGRLESSVIFNKDPVKQARIFENEGCERIHLIDLDGAFGNSTNNKQTILDIRNSVSTEIELGGGIRTEKEIKFWIKNDINFIIVSSLAINEPKNFIKIANIYPEKLYVSLDDLRGRLMIKGWIEETIFTTKQIINKYNNTEIKGFVFTDVLRDGMLKGININKIKKCLEVSEKPIIVGGGLSNYEELEKLSSLKNPLLEGIIAGKSYYLGKIEINKAQKILR